MKTQLGLKGPELPSTLVYMLELSVEQSLEFVLSTSVHGRITEGSVSRVEGKRINVYDKYGRLLEYFSGDSLRSWCVVDLNNEPVVGWHEIEPQDAQRIGVSTSR